VLSDTKDVVLGSSVEHGSELGTASHAGCCSLRSTPSGFIKFNQGTERKETGKCVEAD
jgi:hypothetical protein